MREGLSNFDVSLKENKSQYYLSVHLFIIWTTTWNIFLDIQHYDVCFEFKYCGNGWDQKYDDNNNIHTWKCYILVLLYQATIIDLWRNSMLFNFNFSPREIFLPPEKSWFMVWDFGAGLQNWTVLTCFLSHLQMWVVLFIGPLAVGYLLFCWLRTKVLSHGVSSVA